LIVRQCIPKLHSIPVPEVGRLITQAMRFLISGDYSSLILDSSKAGNEEDGILVGGIYMILYYALASRKKAPVLAKDFATMNIPPAIGAIFAETINSNRVTIEKTMISHRVGLRRLNRLRWRTDVCISSGQLKSVLRPSILIQVCNQR
jgi:hypothetical protein